MVLQMFMVTTLHGIQIPMALQQLRYLEGKLTTFLNLALQILLFVLKKNQKKVLVTMQSLFLKAFQKNMILSILQNRGRFVIRVALLGFQRVLPFGTRDG